MSSHHKSSAGARQAEDVTEKMNNAANPQDSNSADIEIQASAASESSKESSSSEARPERRRRRRALISAPIRVRLADETGNGSEEISTTMDVSRIGILFVTQKPEYYRGMTVALTFPYAKSSVTNQAEQHGCVTRITELPDGSRSVAIALCVPGVDEVPADALALRPGSVPGAGYSREPGAKKPLVLAVDADESLRAMLKSYLSTDGYDVIAVASASEAREVLKTHTPSLLIAEIEGEGLPGYDLCSFVKGTPRLQTIPVMLMTRSAYPSDYSSAHALGAVVCMAKPFKQERLGHVVRLLAPPPQSQEIVAPPRAADLSRRTASAKPPKPQPKSSSSALRRFRFRKS